MMTADVGRSTRQVRWLASWALCAGALASALSAQSTSRDIPIPRVSGPVTGGSRGYPFRSFAVEGYDILTAAGYVESEYFFEGTARSFAPAVSLSSDGRWLVSPASSAAYRSRMVVRRPADPKRFNGTVVVEWLNVTAGFDLDADFAYGHTELLRSGYAWVGVSAQQVGVHGGAPAGFGLTTWDPARYGSLVHPGDSFSYDIFSQAGRALKSPSASSLLGPLRPTRFIADGESQSAGRMVTYINAIHPADRLFDGFIVHSRSSRSAPLSQAPQADAPTPNPSLIRADTISPVLIVQSETDVPGSLTARQLDGPTFRLWEIAGTAHVDQYMSDVSNPVTRRDLATFPGFPCDRPYNDGPHHWVFQAAIHALNRWITSGVTPPSATPISVREGPPVTVERDARGNALGGIRAPQLSVPRATLSGTGNTPAGFCGLFGTTEPFSQDVLSGLYPNGSFAPRFMTATDDAVKAGFILPADAPNVKTLAATPNPSGPR